MMMESVTALVGAAGLGTGAGVNAYATLLVFGLLSRLHPALFHGDLAGVLSSTPMLIVLGVLYTIEFFADKIPAIDHLWDAVHTFIRPLAGGVVAVASVNPEMPGHLLVLAALFGGGAALGGHVVKASARGLSTATTGGVANPLLSLIEDLFAIVQAALAILLPWVALALMMVLLTVGMGVILTWNRRTEKQVD